MERLEPVVSAALTAGGFCLLSRAVPRQCEDGAGDRLEKGAQASEISCSAARGYLAGTVLPEGGAGCRSRHMLGYGAIVNTMGSVRKEIAKIKKMLDIRAVI